MSRPVGFILPAIALVALTAAAYLPAVTCGYVWDDDEYVENNSTLTSVSGLGRIWFDLRATPQYYPLVHTSYWIEYRFWQTNPTGYHVVNILLHALGTVLLWRVLRLLDVSGAWAAAAVFALHPVHVESVAWITERKNVLSGVFYFGAALVYLRHALGTPVPPRQHQPRAWYAASLALFLGALLSKTVTCTLPAVLLLVLWWKRRRIGGGDLRALAPFFVIGVAMGLLTVWLERHRVGAAGAEWNLSLLERCLVAGRVLCFHAGKLLWPTHLTFIYPRWTIDATAWEQYLYPLAAIVVIAALWISRRRIGQGPLVAVLCFAGTLFPALGFIDVYPMRFSFVADHFQYLASAGLIALIGAVASRVAGLVGGPRRRAIAIPALVVALAILGTLTWRQCYVYRDRETLWRDTLAKNPASWLANNNLGTVLSAQGKHQGAAFYFRRALEAGLDPAKTHYNLGTALEAIGQLDEASEHYRKALQIHPRLYNAHNNLGMVLKTRGQLDEAIEHFRRALEIEPDFAPAHNNLGIALKAVGRLDEAASHYRQALQIKPDYAEAHSNLANILAAQGALDDAIDHYRQALQTQPDYADANFNLASVLARQGRFAEATDHFSRAIAANPDDAEAHYRLGKTLLELGRPTDGLDHLRQAARLKPDWPPPLTSLAWTLATHADPTIRRPDEAVQLAQHAAELTAHKHPQTLDALAATYAAAGRYADAVSTAQAALDLAVDARSDELAYDIAQRLQLYRQSQPYRD